MKITLHEAFVDVGYAQPSFSGLDRTVIEHEIAETCRKTWEQPDWEAWWTRRYTPEELESRRDQGLQAAGPPPIPESDADVLATYFWRDPDSDEVPHLLWRQHAVDLSPPCGVPIDLSIDGHFTVERIGIKLTDCRLKGSGAVLDGHLIRYGGFTSDALEGFILALTAAGFPVHLPEFKLALRDYCTALVDRMPDFNPHNPDENVED